MLPGLNVNGTWEIIPNRYGVEFVVGNNRISDDTLNSHLELATGITQVLQAESSKAFGEWDMFKGSLHSTVPARHYAVGGLVFFANRNFAVDIRAGAGLNAPANRFLIGVGFAFRH